MTTTREKKQDEKLRRIKRAADALFRSQGFDATTTRQIADRAEIATGTLFLYVRDKDDALALVYQDGVRAMVGARVASLPSRAGFRRRLLHFFQGFFELYGEHPDLALNFTRRIPTLDPRRKSGHDDLNRSILRVIVDELERGVARGDLDESIDRTVASANVFAIFRVVVFEWLAAPPCEVERGLARLDASLEQLVTGLGARGR